ncbi:4-alpha-glucanotransferase [Galdieria sulphuraria]|uniref:4-alpha-glucanotransferase n=1 Tax=Galdieria sulphuraria TaxID=130081 RepID=M2XZZ2_GALSU|nr:4-alpha-glucanotransferase [Galdieria sulphuraria]EME29203.1 4-alpha-glucanotransferase [Galdieria sulphuraria]|eukprot:XP_005705723.1 4-alpha-glucanotransferase [Galdieria sulphuraria]
MSNDLSNQLKETCSVTGTVCVYFRCHFDSIPGQEVLIAGSCKALGGWDPTEALAMKYSERGQWTAQVTIPLQSLVHSSQQLHTPVLLYYRYLVAEDKGKTRYWEQGRSRQLELCCSDFRAALPAVIVYDDFARTLDQEGDIFSTVAFRDIVFRRNVKQSEPSYYEKYKEAYENAKGRHEKTKSYVLQIQVPAYQVYQKQQILLCGTSEALKSQYDTPDGLTMSDTFVPLWSAFISLPLSTSQFAYTFQIGGGDEVIKENREMRIFWLSLMDEQIIRQSTEPPLVVCHSYPPFCHNQNWRGSGIAIPVFSLRTQASCGVGEFSDLKFLVDFCVKTNFQLVQLLPVNDTRVHNTWVDSYPYSSVSICALHPQYLRLDRICEAPSYLKAELEKERRRLNELPSVDYEEVVRFKEYYILEAYKLSGKEVLQSKEFLEFFEENKAWLMPYAVYRYLLNTTGTGDHTKWGNRSHITMEELEALASPTSLHFDHIGVTYFTQFHLHLQLLEASQYAAEHGVILKGDLPIGVNRNCLDTWLYPHLFRLHMQCGAPPDYFAEFGQNWGFPTYDWDQMASNNFEWWRFRLNQMAQYFHAYRIDHILGFFRIWEIPIRYVNGICGRFFPSIPISRSELESRGLWDMDRYCKPWIRESFIREQFGDDAGQVMNIFFDHGHGDLLNFKECYDTEYKLSRAFEQQHHFKQEWLVLLLRLISNVILLRDEDEPNQLFHPRIDLMKTTSYNELMDDNWKHQFYELYEDYFFHRQDDLWRKKSMLKLPMMKNSTGMLVIGEDLGMIPACVPDVMNALSIIGMRIQRMPADPKVEFGNPQYYEYLTIATPGSHDMATIRGWWEEMENDQRQRFYEQMLARSGDAPRKCEADIVQQILEQHVSSPSIWAIFLFQDILGMDEKLRRDNPAEEQINVPANPKHYWRYRLHVSLETILSSTDFLQKCQKLNEIGARGIL